MGVETKLPKQISLDYSAGASVIDLQIFSSISDEKEALLGGVKSEWKTEWMEAVKCFEENG